MIHFFFQKNNNIWPWIFKYNLFKLYFEFLKTSQNLFTFSIWLFNLCLFSEFAPNFFVFLRTISFVSTTNTPNYRATHLLFPIELCVYIFNFLFAQLLNYLLCFFLYCVNFYRAGTTDDLALFFLMQIIRYYIYLRRFSGMFQIN